MRKVLGIALLLVVGAGFCLAQNDAPLGDVARKKATVKAKRVVTDEDMPSTSAAPAAAEPEKAPPVPTEADLATAAVPATNEDGTPLTPEQKLEAMEQRVSKLKDFENSLEKHLKQVSEKLNNETSEFRRDMYSEALQRQAGTLESFKKQRAQLEAAIAQQKKGPANDDTSAAAGTSSSETTAN